MFDLKRDYNTNNQYLFLIIFIIVLLFLIGLILALKYLLVLYRKMCQSRLLRTNRDENGLVRVPVSLIITGDEENHMSNCEPSSIFQFSATDSSLIIYVSGIPPCRRDIITRRAEQNILYEAIEQKVSMLNPGSVKKPRDEDLFVLQLGLLNYSGAAGVDNNHQQRYRLSAAEERETKILAVLEKKYSLFTNIRRVQKVLEKIWSTVDHHRHCTRTCCLTREQRWICRLLLMANLGIDKLLAGHETNPEMVNALSYVDPPCFLIPRSTRTRSVRTRRSRSGSVISSSSTNPRSAGSQERRDSPPKFDSVVNIDHPDWPPSYENCISGLNNTTTQQQNASNQ